MNDSLKGQYMLLIGVSLMIGGVGAMIGTMDGPELNFIIAFIMLGVGIEFFVIGQIYCASSILRR